MRILGTGCLAVILFDRIKIRRELVSIRLLVFHRGALTKFFLARLLFICFIVLREFSLEHHRFICLLILSSSQGSSISL